MTRSNLFGILLILCCPFLADSALAQCFVDVTIDQSAIGFSRRAAGQNCLNAARTECTGQEMGTVIKDSEKVSPPVRETTGGYNGWKTSCSLTCRIIFDVCIRVTEAGEVEIRSSGPGDRTGTEPSFENPQTEDELMRSEIESILEEMYNLSEIN